MLLYLFLKMICFGFLNGQLHSFLCDYVAESPISVDTGRCISFSKDLRGGAGHYMAFADTVSVHWDLNNTVGVVSD